MLSQPQVHRHTNVMLVADSPPSGNTDISPPPRQFVKQEAAVRRNTKQSKPLNRSTSPCLINRTRTYIRLYLRSTHFTECLQGNTKDTKTSWTTPNLMAQNPAPVAKAPSLLLPYPIRPPRSQATQLCLSCIFMYLSDFHVFLNPFHSRTPYSNLRRRKCLGGTPALQGFGNPQLYCERYMLL